MKIAVFLILLFVSNSALSQSHIRDTSIRKTNWMEYFQHSPDFSIDTIGVDTAWGKYFVLSSDTTFGDPIPGGFPALDYIFYGDLDGNGIEEAAMLFYCGGTAGAMSYAVFRQGSTSPSLVEWGNGYKMGMGMRNDTLLIYQPEYTGGWEPNCCPSSLWTSFYRIKNKKIILTDSTEEGIIEMAAGAADHFYDLLTDKQYETAYQFLGKEYRSAHPLKAWLAGYNNTDSIFAVVDTMRVSDSTVHVTLTAIDRLQNGKKISENYEGTWKMQWTKTQGWLLTEPKIKKVRKK